MGKTLQNAIYPQWSSIPLGYAFPVDDSKSGFEVPPEDHPEFTFIKLTADQDGTGEFNQGKLTNETVSGTAPQIEATAEISATGSPMNGVVVNLINTEGRHVAPGETAGTVHDDQMQQITGQIGHARFGGGTNTVLDDAGALTIASTGSEGPGVQSESAPNSRIVNFDSAGSPNARTGDHTNVKRLETTYYMRIK